jgi:uncharacterized protein GlcG (DUF336 family)
MSLRVTQQMPIPYGLNIILAKSKKIAAAAAKKAARMKVNVVIAIVDAGGHLVYLERSDMAQYGSIEVAIHKAKCSVAYMRPTKFFEDAIIDGDVIRAFCPVSGLDANRRIQRRFNSRCFFPG